MEYAHLLMWHKTSGQKFKALVMNLLAFFNQLRYIFSGKLLKPFFVDGTYRNVILLQDNRVYIQSLLPVVEEAIKLNYNILLLCPAKQLNSLKSTLPAQIAAKLKTFESLSLQESFFVRFVKILISAARGFAAIFGFWGSGLKDSFFFSTAFGRYALTKFCYENTVKKLFSGNQATTLLAANDHWFWESLFFTIAGKTNAQTFVIQHGVTGELSYPLFAKAFLAWGLYDANKLINECGAIPQEMIVAGSPYFNKVYSGIRDFAGGADNKFDKPYITYLAQPAVKSNFMDKDDYFELVNWFLKLDNIATKTGKKLLIKLHPQEHISDYNSVKNKAEISEEKLYDVLAKSCLVLTVDSTSLFEAAMFKVPVIQVMQPNLDRVDLSSTGISIKLQSDEEVLNYVSQLIENEENYKAAVEKMQNSLGQFYYNLGEAPKDFLERFLHK